MDVGVLAHPDNVLVGRGRPSRAYVLVDAATEERWLLRHDAHLAAPPHKVQVSQVDAVDEDLPLLGVVEALQQCDDRRLAAAGGPSEGVGPSTFQLKVEVLQDNKVGSGGVTECDVDELNCTCKGRAAVLAQTDVLARRGVDVDHRNTLNSSEHLAGGTTRGHHGGDRRRHQAQRHARHDHGEEGRHDLADGVLVVVDEDRGVPEGDGVGRVRYKVDDARGEANEEVLADAGRACGQQRRRKALNLDVYGVEGVHGADVLDGLRGQRPRVGVGRLSCVGESSHDGAEEAPCDGQQWQRAHAHERELPRANKT
eukprot:PhM_4_TR10894/c2_g1_i1/m.19535